jgi:hypothetical protein
MVEKRIQNTAVDISPNANNEFKVEEIGEEIQLPQPENTSPGIEIVEEADGGVTLDYDPQQKVSEGDYFANLAEFMDDDLLEKLSSDLQKNFEDDKNSRSDWEKTYKDGLDLLGFKYEERSKPFAGAAGVTHPLLAEAVTQFQAQAYKELLPPGGPVRTEIIGVPTAEVEQQAERIKEFMNYQITCEMGEFDPELDQLLFHLPLAGSAFKKVYYDSTLERAVSKFIPAEDLVVPYFITDLESCSRITHVVKMKHNDLRKNQVSGFYRDIDLSGGRVDTSDIKEKQDELSGIEQVSFTEDEHNLLEMHVDLDLPWF